MITTSDLVCISYIPNETDCCCTFDRIITDMSPSLDPLCLCTTVSRGKKAARSFR